MRKQMNELRFLVCGALIVCAAVLFVVAPAAQAGNVIDPGDDHYSVSNASFNFNSTSGCSPPIPADFFGPGSDPFEGQIGCQGDPANYGMDMIISRVLPGSVPPPYPAVAPIPIEIVALNLISIGPITVTSGTNPPELWDVDVDLSPAPPAPIGTMTVTKTHPNGGTFQTEIHVQPRFTFTKVSNPAEIRVLDTGLEGITPTQYNDVAPYPWVESPIGNDFNPSGNSPLGMNGGGGCTLTLVPFLIRYDWFDISFDLGGFFMGGWGSGYNDGTGVFGTPWYEYPNSGWWNQWFYDHPYSPNRTKYFHTQLMIFPWSPGAWATIIYNWATPDWPDPSRPPLPGDVDDPADPGLEDRYIGRSDAMGEYIYDGPVEFPIPVFNEFRFPDYNPEWISIDIWGYGIDVISESFWHVCEPTSTLIAKDWGDAEDLAGTPKYPTLAVHNGANHIIVQGFHLGASVDAEGDGQPTPTADGDDNDGNNDADGVAFVTPLIPGLPATVDVTASVGGGFLNAWIDFGNDGSWAEAGDQIAFGVVPLVAGTNSIGFTVPAGAAPGTTTSRFRFSTVAALPYDGPAPNGEVEDHIIDIGTSAGWNEGDPYKMHYPQLPDLNDTGMDILAGPLSEITQLETFLADDFLCTGSGPITGIHIWCSYNFDMVLQTIGSPFFSLVIYEDIPAGVGGINYSRPGVPVWDAYLQPTATLVYAQVPYEAFYDPIGAIVGEDHAVWQLNFIIDEATAFVQEAGTIYWLGLKHTFDLDGSGFVDPFDLNMFLINWPGAFGWKTSDLAQVPHFNDDAVWTIVDTFFGDPHVIPFGDIWSELRYPFVHPWATQSIDLAFVIDGPVQQVDIDWGDAPDPSYPTLSANAGANHVIDLNLPWLGTQSDPPDAEPDGQPFPPALGDNFSGADDENGVVFPTLVSGTTVHVSVDVFDPSGGIISSVVEIWIDYNISGSWEAAELVYTGLHTTGNFSIPIAVPTGLADGLSYARCRISSAGTGSVTGGAPDGEVEDYEVIIERERVAVMPKFRQLPMDGIVEDILLDKHYFGHDELSTMYMSYDATGGPTGYAGCYMADDFADNRDTPVIRLKWWGSYMEEVYEQPIDHFLIVFETDVPAGFDPILPYSHPGTVILSQEVWRSNALGSPIVPLSPGQFSEMLVPGPSLKPPCDESLYEYEAYLDIPFDQEPHTVYWVKIVALVDFGPVEWDLLKTGADIYPNGELCELLNTPLQNIFNWTGVSVTRWGWHNRDYTVRNPYASRQVLPGEYLDGTVYDPISDTDLEIWHFQDDAVSGDITVDLEGTIDQLTYIDEYYKYTWPLCGAAGGVDGPFGIQDHSKDLAFELLTTECLTPATAVHPVGHPKAGVNYYTQWVNMGRPECWCSARHCHGDADAAIQGYTFTGYEYVGTNDLAILANSWGILEPNPVTWGPTGPGIATITSGGFPGICADFDHSIQGYTFTGYEYVGTNDLAILANSWGILEPNPVTWGPTGPGIPANCGGTINP